MKNIFETNAAELESLRQKIYAAARRRSEGPEQRAAWEKTSRAFFTAYDQLAFPGGLNRQFELLKTGDAEAIEMAIRYLEADPWYFRSGYYKADMLRFLRKHPLSDDQSSRLRVLILKRVRGRHVRETRDYCRFAPKVTNPEFEAEIRSIADNSNRVASRHAQWVIDCLKSAGGTSQPR
jgi:hypothetical protein